jgi:hypothetical protein
MLPAATIVPEATARPEERRRRHDPLDPFR